MVSVVGVRHLIKNGIDMLILTASILKLISIVGFTGLAIYWFIQGEYMLGLLAVIAAK
jgi:hypothetical protein